MKTTFTGALIASAVAGLFAAGALASDTAAPKETKKKETATVKCEGVNECKGKGACGGANSSCAGTNACKGKGWIVLTEAECKAKGGKKI